MRIGEVTTAVKVADVVRNETKSQAEIKFRLTCDKETQTNSNPRVYFLVVDDVIRKIGYSEAKGGIKGTLGAYQGGLGGTPSLRTYGIHKLLSREVKGKRKVEVFMVINERVVADGIKGLFGIHNGIEVKISGKNLEDICMRDYFTRESVRPDWNIQEQSDRDWPRHIRKGWQLLVGK